VAPIRLSRSSTSRTGHLLVVVLLIVFAVLIAFPTWLTGRLPRFTVVASRKPSAPLPSTAGEHL
jgi:hypothetical protein